MASLVHQRCANHYQREAVARCLGCRGYYCRECVTEHDDRVLCARCLAREADRKQAGKRRLAHVLRAVLFLIMFIFAWFLIYNWGELLLRIPSSFHESTFMSHAAGDGD